MPGHDVIVVGASAGGVEALVSLVRGLPRRLPAVVFIVLHMPADARSLLPPILAHSGTLPLGRVADGAPFEPGHLYVAPPGQHILLEPDSMRLDRGPRVNGHRPAVDPLFRSAAKAFGPRVVALVLSGTMSDGTAGARAVKDAGGLVIVQDPAEALFPSMPESVIANVGADFVLPSSQIAGVLAQLAQQPVETGEIAVVPDEEQQKAEIARDMEAQERGERPNLPSVLTCPACGGVLWEMREGNLVEYRCHVGHAYELESLDGKQADRLEEALWTAIRALIERAVLNDRLATHASELGRDRATQAFDERAREAREAAEVLRRLAQNGHGD